VRAGLGRRREAVADWERAAQLDLWGEAHARQSRGLAAALARAARGEHAEAVAAAAALRRDPKNPPDVASCRRLAYVYVWAADAARRRVPLPVLEKARLQETYQRQAVELLLGPHRAGFFNNPVERGLLRADPVLAPLRARADFRRLLPEENSP
jgi:hypothetical protein